MKFKVNLLVQRLLRDWFRLSSSRGGDVDNFLAKETWEEKKVEEKAGWRVLVSITLRTGSTDSC